MRRLAPVMMSLAFLGCGRARSEPAAHAPADGASKERPAEAEAGESSGPGAAPAATDAAPAGAKKAKSAGDAEAEEQPATDANAEDDAETTLTEHERLLHGALAPSALSCSGAEPHVKSICAIAERICQSSKRYPSTMAARDCQSAAASCEKAKRDYAARCE